MKTSIAIAVLAVCACLPNAMAVNTADSHPDRARGTPTGEDMIVFTANQEWLSRIYLLNSDGSVYTYYEYDFYRFVDLEVVANEVFVAEAFAPRVLKVDLFTGALDVIVDDWSLYYFYDLAFDGSFFYLDEWDLNRYDINGDKDGVASFDQTVFGSAFDGVHLRTLGEDSLVRCWDVSGWPDVVEIPANAFAPPSGACRGLWFDGRYYWSAESLDGQLGYIYVFDGNGTVVSQFSEPAFSGWSACLVRGNHPPTAPQAQYPPDTSGLPVFDMLTSFYWSPSSDPDPYDTIHYRLEIATDSGFVSDLTIDSLPAPTHTLADSLEFSTHYWWRVTAFDNSGMATMSVNTPDFWTWTLGDLDHSHSADISDLVMLVDWMFSDGPAPYPLFIADIDGSCSVDISDLVYLVDWMFGDGPPPLVGCE